MAVPPIEINVRADTAQAEASLKRVGDQAEVAGTRVRSGASGMTAGAVQANRSFMVLGGQSRMLTQQLSQVAQQATATGQVGQALAVQAADIGLAFGTVGTIVGALVGITLPSLISAFSSTNEKVQSVEESLDGLRGGFERVKSQQDALIGLRQSYVDAINNSQNILAANLQQEIELRSGILRVEQALFQQELAGMKRVRNEREAEIALVRERIDQEIAMLDLNGPGQEAARRQAVNEITQRHIEQNRELFSEQRRLNTEIELMELEYERTQMAIDEATASMNEFDAAIIRSKANAEALAAVAATMGQSVAGGRGTIQDPRARMRTELERQLVTPESAATSPRVGGGGGGGVSRRDTTQADLERVQEFLMSETELIQSAHEERLEALRAAREAELLTQEQFNELEAELQRQHAERLIGIDVWRYGNQLDQAEAFFGQAANALAGGNSKMIELSRKFAAVEATINAGRAFAQVAADPSLPWFAKIPAAIGVASAISQFATSSGIGGGGGGGGSGGAASAAQQAQQPITTFSFTLQNDPMGFGESFARQMIEQLNATQRNGGTIRGVINNA